MNLVRITKLSSKKKVSSIPLGYFVEGFESEPPTVGQALWLEPFCRDSQNNRFDWFSTTIVVGVDGDTFETGNSLWRREVLKKNFGPFDRP